MCSRGLDEAAGAWVKDTYVHTYIHTYICTQLYASTHTVRHTHTHSTLTLGFQRKALPKDLSLDLEFVCLRQTRVQTEMFRCSFPYVFVRGSGLIFSCVGGCGKVCRKIHSGFWQRISAAGPYKIRRRRMGTISYAPRSVTPQTRRQPGWSGGC